MTVCPQEVKERLTNIDPCFIIPGETVWWPLGPSNWGFCKAEAGKWYPSAVLMVERHPMLIMHELRPVRQTLLDESGEIGNCLQASIATLLSIDLPSVPHFALFGTRWMNALNDWTTGVGLSLANVDHADGLCILVGKSPRGIKHCCVGFTDEVIWDPHPSNSGLAITDYALVLTEKTRT